MKHSLRLTLLLAAAVGSLSAQEGTKWVQVQGAYAIQNAPSLKDGLFVGVNGGAWLSNRFGVDLWALTSDLKDKAPGSNLHGREIHSDLSLLVNLDTDALRTVPFLRVGAGSTHLEEPWATRAGGSSRFNWHVGVGAQRFWGENLIGSLEGRMLRMQEHFHHVEYMALAGIGFRWGGPKAAPAAAPAPRVEQKVEVRVAPPPVVEAPKPAPPPPPPPPVEAAKLAPPPPPPPAKIVLDEAVLHFANGKNVLSDEGIQAVQKVAAELKQFTGNYTIVVSGYTSSTGSAAFNKALSKHRAEAVAKVLVESGIPIASIRAVGVGPDKPIADNATAEGQAKNRRVEIEVNTQGADVEKRQIGTQVVDSSSSKPKAKKKH